MEGAFSVVLYLLYGFFGLLLLLFVLAALFGRRRRRRFEAGFRDMGGNEFGEFEIEVSRAGRQESSHSFKARFRMQHDSLEKGQQVGVYLDDSLVMQGKVGRNGRILLRDKAARGEFGDVREGRVCRVVWGGIEQFRAPLEPD
jgi:hypothetical protein